ncbi:unnamed protein product [Paramecium octaurelia]|uniref:Uncharacterized protein n=1 Tax=Paramecium octaurelia TaxID=43137 RepID=A0A8S1YR85_PAROT|nr:unnamed protein product [Paramecium octaurelia]
MNFQTQSWAEIQSQTLQHDQNPSEIEKIPQSRNISSIIKASNNQLHVLKMKTIILRIFQLKQALIYQQHSNQIIR